jgi:hypothetical protein
MNSAPNPSPIIATLTCFLPGFLPAAFAMVPPSGCSESQALFSMFWVAGVSRRETPDCPGFASQNASHPNVKQGLVV